MNIYSRYSPAIQRYIYSEGWSKLRAIQAAAGDAIFNSDANVLLSASTASGKTEAAFFPIITLLQEKQPSKSPKHPSSFRKRPRPSRAPPARP